MFTEHQQDIEDINAARSRYNARKTASSLIAWICSDEWSDPALAGMLFGRDGAPWVDSTARGKVIASAWGGDEANTISGEIEAYTRDHVDAFAAGGGL